MKNNRTPLLLAYGAFVLVFSVLTIVFWAQMSDTILVPVYYFLWICSLVLNSVPQGLYLALLVLLSLVIGSKTLGGLQTNQRYRRVQRNLPDSGTRYLHWRNLCIHSHGTWFSKGQLAFEARNLILSILAFEQGVDLVEAEAMVRNGTLDVPDVLRNVIQLKNIPDTPPNRFTGIRFWLRRPFHRMDTRSDPYVEQLLTELIRFVEYHLEIPPHAGNESES